MEQKYKDQLRWWVLLTLALLGTQVLAQTAPSATDNFATNAVWFVVKMVFYGMGGAMVFFGILKPAYGIVFKGSRMQEVSWMPLLAGIIVLAFPSILQFAVNYWNADSGGALSNLVIGLDGVNTGGGSGTP